MSQALSYILYIYFLIETLQLYEIDTIIVPILKMKTLRLRTVKERSHDHPAGE